MTHELGPDARALLDATRDAHDPSTDDKTRVKKAVLASIAATAATTAAVTAEAAPTTAAALGVGAKVGIAIGVAGIVAVTAVALRPQTTTPSAVLEHPSIVQPAEVDEPVLPVEVVTPEAPVVTDEEAPVIAPAKKPAKRVVKRVAKAEAPTPAVIDASTLAAEASLLSEVRIALGAQRYEDVLQRVDAHHTKFPNGLLREEALAARVLALCGLERTEDAAQARVALTALAPRSAHLARIDRVCR